MIAQNDLNVVTNVPLPSPASLQGNIPATAEQMDFVSSSRRQISDIIFRQDERLLLIVGPCSIHDPETCLNYAERLVKLAQEVEDKILIVMRVYFEKPRTTVGWKGLIMDPDLDGSDNIVKGLTVARNFLKEILQLGLPTATELLDPITPQFIADLICWSAIGARTSESQTHRQMASGLSMPLGFKNATSGSITAATNAIKAATKPQTFLGVSSKGIASAVTTKGNPHCHLILRGGENGSNYDQASIASASGMLRDEGLPETIMIDASHANCQKKQELMPTVFEAIVAQRAAGNKALTGAMLESHLVAGNQPFPQPLENLTRGQSITDQCIDWATTERIIKEAAARL